MIVRKWPKDLSPLTEQQKKISDDFMKYWHEVFSRRFEVIDRFNQSYAVKHAPQNFERTLEIGAGIGEHLEYERLNSRQERKCHALELSPRCATGSR